MGQAMKPIEPVRDAIEEQVDQAIALCDGDLRKTVRCLILGQTQMALEMAAAVSAGYVRRRLQ